MPRDFPSDFPDEFTRPIGVDADGGPRFEHALLQIRPSGSASVTVLLRVTDDELERIARVAAKQAADECAKAVDRQLFDLRTELYRRDSLASYWSR